MIKKLQLFALLAYTAFVQTSGNEEYIDYVQAAKKNLADAKNAEDRCTAFRQLGYSPVESLIASIEDGHNDVEFYRIKFGTGILKGNDPVTGKSIEKIAYQARNLVSALKVVYSK